MGLCLSSRISREADIDFFDTAEIYGRGKSESILGALVGRDQGSVVVATKFGWALGDGLGGASRRYIVRAAEASLRRLGTDTIDLYQQHVPDPDTPIDETLRALEDLVRAGKVRYIGNSNFAGWQIADAAWTSRVNHVSPFVSAQNRYSVLSREIEREGGAVVKYIGDSVMAVFGVPASREDDAQRAVRAAVAMAGALEKLNEELERDWGVHLAIRTGVHTGELVTGEQADSRVIGASELIVGDVMNTASRIEQATRDLGRAFLVSADALDRLTGTERYDLEPLGPHVLRGRAAPVQIFAVAGAR